MFESLKYISILLFTTFVSGIALADENNCKLKGRDFTAAAANAGYKITHEKLSGEGSCSVINNSVVVGANQTVNTICQFTFFSGLNFENDTIITRVEFTKPFDFTKRFEKENPSFSIVVKANKGETKSLTLASIYIESDVCSEWRSKF